MSDGFECFKHVGLALDPIHVGTGGARLGRVDLSIVRDPVTKIPKIPGSSLAGVHRAYVAMAEKKYPGCAGQGQPDTSGAGGHCCDPKCPVCTVFGFAKGKDSTTGFTGLAAFSDVHIQLFPVATREGPLWVTSPEQLRIAGLSIPEDANADAVYRKSTSSQPLNLGWLLLPVKALSEHSCIRDELNKLGVPKHILDRFGVVPDRLFSHVVNSNLEVRTSVSINPETGAAEEGALFTYEALPRATLLFWEVTCKNPKHFKIGNKDIEAANNKDKVHSLVKKAYPYLEHLGIGGMGTRGMGRLRVLEPNASSNHSSEIEQSDKDKSQEARH
ncbi:MAG: type III-B CRISPR module RAMP protein Cmr4 [Methanothrix sp.]|jgi:CRISPR-associated protein Cmr4|uniref:type III-B CRISPR module RAMP protein Cmr4 n=1 Tax=Methanothrix sp. TaxID=90426 RepID=UPI0025E1C084|nr:type III-B CRISPR module RAMP protein Cmr4 [Methanothrix sp.]MBK7386544.1 type III-B CRISPR module RAMP protein Cmr4 [Methanothrix sp.]HPW72813.1 type III-B CRISPR module RAMP protein Cmr4 [Methanothrix sp.]